MSSSHDEISSDDEMFPDRPLMPWMIGGPAGAPTHNLDDNYHDWKDPIDPKDPDELTLSTFVASAQRNDKNADQRARRKYKKFHAPQVQADAAQAQADAAIQAQARADAQAQAGAALDAQMKQKLFDKYKLEADRVPNCEEIRNYYAYYRQPPNLQDVINKFIANPAPFPPFGGLQQEENYSPVQRAAAEAAAAAAAARRGGYKSKSKSKSKLKSMKCRKRKLKSMKCRKIKSNRLTRRT